MSDPAPDQVLRDRLAGLAAAVRAAESRVRSDQPEGVHDLRVAMRRTRSLLRTFRSLLGPDVVPETERMRAELRWAGGELSAVRDLEVVHGRLDAEGADEPGEPLPAPVVARLEQHREEAGAAARAQVDRLLGSDRYLRMLDDLDVLTERISWEEVTVPAARERLRKDWRRARRRAEAARDAAPGEEERALHEVRKAAKRARYAAETLAPALGDNAGRMAGVAERVQDTLGGHRDTLLTRELLHRLGVDESWGDDVESVFALGRLHALEQARGAEALEDYERAREEMDRKRHRRWLR